MGTRKKQQRGGSGQGDNEIEERQLLGCATHSKKDSRTYRGGRLFRGGKKWGELTSVTRKIKLGYPRDGLGERQKRVHNYIRKGDLV